MFSKTPAIAEAGPVTFAAKLPPGEVRRALMLDNTSSLEGSVETSVTPLESKT